MFDPVDPKQSLPDLEEGILQYWQEEDTFKRSLKRKIRIGNVNEDNIFSFYDGPPFATGLPHYGHILAGTIKDVIPRYQTMKGKSVERRFGWDCHGLPIENMIEQENDIKNKQEIEERGVKWFNDLCRLSVQRYTKEWQQIVKRMGRWVDMDWDYRTLDPEYMESMWWAFYQLHQKGLIYEGHKPMHICPRCVTPLSNFEVTQGYKDITDQSVVAKFEICDDEEEKGKRKKERGKMGNEKLPIYLLAWTTTPWTLPGNLLLAINKQIKYVQFQIEDCSDIYIASKSFVDYQIKNSKLKILNPPITPVKISSLVGKQYKPLFPYFEKEYKDTAFKIVEGDFVTTDEGTGIVHIAPGFGEDDFMLGEKENLKMLQHVTIEGKFSDDVTDFAGMDVKPKDDPMKTDRKVTDWLKKNNKLFADQTFSHSYPHCWRCDSPLLNYATGSWFVQVEKIREKMLKENAKTEWVPKHIREGRFGKWLEGARDWAISRNRYWGTPLPVWKSAQGDMECMGSRDDIMNRHSIRFTKITVLRHGESEGNITPIYQGIEPGTNLTANGKAQAKKTAQFLKSQGVKCIYCSPLNRTKQTAEIIAKETGAQLIIDDRLREIAFGEYEGKTVDFTDLSFVKARRAHKLDKNKPESIYHFDGMETWEHVQARIESFLKETLPKHRSDHIAVVTHADPLQNVKAFFTGEDPIKISHQPYPYYAFPHTFFWDHKRNAQMDLHKDNVDDIVWQGSKCKESIYLTLVRHGETDWNKEHKLQGGDADNPLNETGREQAFKLATNLKGKSFDYVVSSDRKRSRETAEILSKELNIPLANPISFFSERFLGKWSGMDSSDFLSKHDCRAGISYETPDEGESLSEFLNRVQNGIDELHNKYGGKKILLVSHHAVMQAMQAIVENRAYSEMKNIVFKNAEPLILHLHPPMKRVPEVLDCWFESGSMPYAQQHYPFEMGDEKRSVPRNFPANFIAEGLDQTRAWFYTLMVLSTALFGRTPFENVVVNGIVLAEDGKKMSKRLRNYPDPMEVVNKHGADAVRFALMSSPAVRAEDLRFSEKLVEETVRNVLLPLWNIYSFFVTYANAAEFEPAETRKNSPHPLDEWIKAETQDLVNRMTEQLDKYDLSATCNELYETIDALTNWYIRLSRRRFAGKGMLEGSLPATGDAEAEDRINALHTLYDVLLTTSQLLAPFCPYITDSIYLNLISEEHGSIHLTDWPETKELSKTQIHLLGKNRTMRKIVSLGNNIRSERKIKIRQPLPKATIALPPALSKSLIFTQEDLLLLKQELNVKSIEFADNPDKLAESFVQVDARKAGPRLGAKVQEIISAGKRGEFSVNEDGVILILDEHLSPDEASIVYRSKNKDEQDTKIVSADNGIVLQLETDIPDNLVAEGIARDIIRSIQRLRKESNMHFTDEIYLSIEGLDNILDEFSDLISHETRATFAKNDGETNKVKIAENEVIIRFKRK